MFLSIWNELEGRETHRREEIKVYPQDLHRSLGMQAEMGRLNIRWFTSELGVWIRRRGKEGRLPISLAGKTGRFPGNA